MQRNHHREQCHRTVWSLFAALALALTPVAGTAMPSLVAMGDSIGEGVQSADASWSTQSLTYISWVTLMAGGQPSAPYLKSSLLGIVGNPSGRDRLDPAAISNDVAVSGATLADLLYDRADATSEAEINDELDLVLYPRLQTQIEYAESVAPDILLCWIGNNDVLSAATSFFALDASQLTPVTEFDQDFKLLADRLGGLVTNHGTKVVLANIPNVTDIGFLVSKSTAEAMLGFSVRLTDDEFTTIVAVILMSLVRNDDLLGNPDFVLDATELATVQDRIAAFNLIIGREAARIGVPVVDVNARFNEFITNPPVIGGKQLRPFLMQGLFSLDGVHPNLIGHALVANEFITVMNLAYNMNMPQLPQSLLEAIYYLDPEIDKDGDGSARGRLGGGLLETVAWLLGITGDTDDFTPD